MGWLAPRVRAPGSSEPSTLDGFDEAFDRPAGEDRVVEFAETVLVDYL